MAFALVLKANRGISPLGFPCTTLYAELQKIYRVMQHGHTRTTVAGSGHQAVLWPDILPSAYSSSSDSNTSRVMERSVLTVTGLS